LLTGFADIHSVKKEKEKYYNKKECYNGLVVFYLQFHHTSSQNTAI